jgi:hypothetical protein
MSCPASQVTVPNGGSYVIPSDHLGVVTAFGRYMCTDPLDSWPNGVLMAGDTAGSSNTCFDGSGYVPDPGQVQCVRLIPDGMDAQQQARIADMGELWLYGVGALALLWCAKQFLLRLIWSPQ